MIGDCAFRNCSSLESFCFPGSVESVGLGCFKSCRKILTVNFEHPSHLRKLLSLPTECVNCVDIPDSVEILSIEISKKIGHMTFRFGEESKLMEMKFSGPPEYKKSNIPIRGFIHVPAQRLKVLRQNDEFVTCLPRPFWRII
jgi:hypothetical protein